MLCGIRNLWNYVYVSCKSTNFVFPWHMHARVKFTRILCSYVSSLCACVSWNTKFVGLLTDWRSNGALYARISPSISCSMGHMHWVMLGYVNSSCVCVEWNTKPLDLLTNRLMVVFCTHMWIHCFCVLFDICIGWMWIQRVRLVVVGFIMMLKFCWHGAIVTTELVLCICCIELEICVFTKWSMVWCIHQFCILCEICMQWILLVRHLFQLTMAGLYYESMVLAYYAHFKLTYNMI